MSRSTNEFCFPAPLCSGSGRGIHFTLSGTAPIFWTTYHVNFTATAWQHSIVFGFFPDNGLVYYLDEVSVTNANSPSAELLVNPSFETSAFAITGWSDWCNGWCGINAASIVTGLPCSSFVQKCVKIQCQTIFVESLAQSVSTVPGDKYAVSFQLLGMGTTNYGLSTVALDIY